MNICAVRTLKNGFGNDSALRVLHSQPLSHEPASEQRFRIDLTTAIGYRSDFAVCKHCGSIYAIEDGSE